MIMILTHTYTHTHTHSCTHTQTHIERQLVILPYKGEITIIKIIKLLHKKLRQQTAATSHRSVTAVFDRCVIEKVEEPSFTSWPKRLNKLFQLTHDSSLVGDGEMASMTST